MVKKRWVRLGQSTVYHVMNRVVRRQFWLDGDCRNAFVRLLHRQARFAGVEVLTYCVMTNHVHLLVRVPPSPYLAYQKGQVTVDDGALIARYREFYGNRRPRGSYPIAELERRLAVGGSVADEARRRVLARMGDLSVFMRELKHNFVLWFNDHHKNEGTLWAAKFKSLLLEDSVEVCSRVAAYIDLNPVRAKMIEDPAEYAWSGYGRAMAGHPPECCGLWSIFKASGGGIPMAYQQRMGGMLTAHPGSPNCSGSVCPIDRSDRSDVADQRKNWGAFLGGRAAGSREFMEAIQQHFNRGTQRRDRPRRMELLAGQPFFALFRWRRSLLSPD